MTLNIVPVREKVVAVIEKVVAAPIKVTM